MNVLCGLYQPDEGTSRSKANSVASEHPETRHRAGIWHGASAFHARSRHKPCGRIWFSVSMLSPRCFPQGYRPTYRVDLRTIRSLGGSSGSGLAAFHRRAAAGGDYSRPSTDRPKNSRSRTNPTAVAHPPGDPESLRHHSPDARRRARIVSLPTNLTRYSLCRTASPSSAGKEDRNLRRRRGDQ